MFNTWVICHSISGSEHPELFSQVSCRQTVQACLGPLSSAATSRHLSSEKKYCAIQNLHPANKNVLFYTNSETFLMQLFLVLVTVFKEGIALY